MPYNFQFGLDAVRIGQYSNGRTALIAVDELGIPIAKLTVNIPAVEVGEDEVIIKDYSENEGLLQHLIKIGLVDKKCKRFEYGMVDPVICRLLTDDLKPL